MVTTARGPLIVGDSRLSSPGFGAAGGAPAWFTSGSLLIAVSGPAGWASAYEVVLARWRGRAREVSAATVAEFFDTMAAKIPERLSVLAAAALSPDRQLIASVDLHSAQPPRIDIVTS